MASKTKLKRKLRKQKTRHLLQMSDLQIEYSKLNYDCAQLRGQIALLEEANDKLKDDLFLLTHQNSYC